MNIAIILAGGIGSRLGATDQDGNHIPKQFVKVLGKPVLVYTIEAFERHPNIEAIEVVCVESYLKYLQDLVTTHGLNKVKWIVKGGGTFQESVMNGVVNLEGKISDKDIVLVHFGASPFIGNEIISDAIKVCAEKGNAISTTDFYLLSGIKQKTLSVTDATNASSEYINRDTIACMNSPHAFQYDFINRLYKEAIETGAIQEVEPHTTSLMYKLGKTIYFSKGSQTNIKITHKEDLDLFEGYLLMKKKRMDNKYV